VLSDWLSKKENEELQIIIEENKADVELYYHKNYIRNKIRKLLKIPWRLGEFYHSQSKEDDFIRRAVDIKQTKESPKLVKHYQDENKISKERPEKCDMTTSTPCTWSKTHWSNDRCDKCGIVFPEWN